MAIGPDRVQVLKWENAAEGGNAVDDVPFPAGLDPNQDALEAAGLYLQEPSVTRDEAVFLERHGNDMRFRDLNNTTPVTLTDLLGGTTSGITEAQHEALDTLTHEVDETSYEEAVYSGNELSTYTVWTSAAKTMKVREEQYSYNANRTVSQVVTIQYDGTGTEKMRMTEVYSYNATKRVSSVTRTKVP